MADNSDNENMPGNDAGDDGNDGNEPNNDAGNDGNGIEPNADDSSDDTSTVPEGLVDALHAQTNAIGQMLQAMQQQQQIMLAMHQQQMQQQQPAQQQPIQQILEQRAADERARRDEEKVAAAAALGAPESALASKLKDFGQTTTPVTAIEMLEQIRVNLQAITVPAARRERVAALLEPTRPADAAVVRTWHADKFNQIALNEPGADWRIDLLALLGTDPPSLLWLAPTKEGETIKDYVLRSSFHQVFGMIVKVHARQLRHLQLNFDVVQRIADASLQVQIAQHWTAALKNDLIHQTLIQALNQPVNPITTVLTNNAFVLAKFNKTRAWSAQADAVKKSNSNNYAVSASFHDGSSNLAKRPVALAHHGALAAPVWISALIDTCGSHTHITRELAGTLPGVPLPALHAAPINDVRLADGTVSTLAKPSEPIVIDVFLPSAFGDSPRRLIAHVVESAAFSIIIGVSGIHDLGGAEILVDGNRNHRPTVRFGAERNVPDTTTARAPTATATKHNTDELDDHKLQSVLLMFDAMAIELIGTGLVDDDGNAYITQAQAVMAQELAERAICDELDSDEARTASACLFAPPDLTSTQFNAITDAPDAEDSKNFKYASGRAKLDKMIDEHPDLPTEHRKYLKTELDKINATFISSEAPHAQYGPLHGPGSVFYMRVKHDADYSNMFSGWRPKSKPQMDELRKTKELWLSSLSDAASLDNLPGQLLYSALAKLSATSR